MRVLQKFLVVACFYALSPIVCYALEFALFGDITMTDSTQANQHSEFVLGEVDFFATTALDGKSRAFIEYVFEHEEEGIVTDVERLWISRELTDEIDVAVGRFHSPIGYWNIAFHHGSFIQDTISRPVFLEFEDSPGGVLPMHVVGLLLRSNVRYKKIDFEIDAFVGNGPSIDTDELDSLASPDNRSELIVSASGDNNSDKARGVRVKAFFSKKLGAGFSYYAAAISESGEGRTSGVERGGELSDQQIYSFDFQLQYANTSIVSEYYRILNDTDIGNKKTYSSNAFYIQLGWSSVPHWKWYVRYEELDINRSDSYFQLFGTQGERRKVFATRFELSESNAIKAETYRRQTALHGNENVFSLQWAFLIP